MKFSLSTTAAIAAALSLLSTQTSTAFAPAASIVNKYNAMKVNANKPLNTPLLHMSDNDDWSAPKSAMIGGAGVNNAGEPPFEIRGYS